MLHKNISAGDRHPVHDFEFVDATARDAHTYVTGDVGKEAKLDAGTFWRIISVTTGVATFREVAAATGDISGKENTTNKVVTLSGASTDAQYPSAKLLFDQLQLIYDSLLLKAASVLTGFSAAAGTVASTDTVVQGISKIVGNIDALAFFKTISVAGQTDVVADSNTDTLTLVAGTNVTITTDSATDSITIAASGGGAGATLSANTFTGNQTLSDNQLIRAMSIDCGLVVLAKGAVSGTVTFDYTAGSVQSATFSAGAVTLAFSNWPPTGNLGFIEVRATNAGLATITFPTVNWKKKDDTYTTTFATYLADRGGETALKASGLDTFVFWTIDAGTTLYGCLL